MYHGVVSDYGGIDVFLKRKFCTMPCSEVHCLPNFSVLSRFVPTFVVVLLIFYLLLVCSSWLQLVAVHSYAWRGEVMQHRQSTSCLV